jgi:hypothetical protein
MTLEALKLKPRMSKMSKNPTLYLHPWSRCRTGYTVACVGFWVHYGYLATSWRTVIQYVPIPCHPLYPIVSGTPTWGLSNPPYPIICIRDLIRIRIRIQTRLLIPAGRAGSPSTSPPLAEQWKWMCSLFNNTSPHPPAIHWRVRGDCLNHRRRMRVRTIRKVVFGLVMKR